MVNYRICRSFALFWVMCLFTAILTIPTFAGEATDLVFIRQVNPIKTDITEENIRFNPQEISELKLVATGLIRLYQKFVSSQDNPTCTFTPSCSRFGMACIQEYGMFRGILLTADRLLRCNGSKSGHYHKDLRTGKYIDPISNYAK